MIGIVAARRAGQAVSPKLPLRNELSVISRSKPLLGFLRDVIAQFSQRIGIGMPAADREEAFVRGDMHIETRGVNVFAQRVAELDADVGFIGSFVARKRVSRNTRINEPPILRGSARKWGANIFNAGSIASIKSSAGSRTSDS